MAIKTCTKCGVKKSIECFPRDKQKNDGYRGECKECKNKVYRQRKARFTDDDRARLCANQLRYFERNPEKRKQRRQDWAKRNRDRINETNRRKYHTTHREIFLKYNHDRRARIRGAEGSYSEEQIGKLWHLQKGKCAICRNKLPKSYQRDHIEPISEGGSNYIQNIQLLCASCNARKNASDPIEYMQKLGQLL